MAVKKIVKGIIITVVVLAVIAGALIGLRFFLNRGSEEVVTYQVKKETYENVIEISGTVAAAQEQTLQALSAGTVMGVYVKAGDHVKKGDVLLKLDDTSEQYNLAKHDYDMDKTRITGSAKELKLMQTQRLSLLQKIADRKVVATFDGIIADLDVAVGDSLEAKDKVGTIVNTDYLTADVEVAETDVSKLKVGQNVDFTFSAYEKGVVHGYVVSWPAIGEITSRGATIVKVRVRIDEYPEEILPNFSFTGKIQISPTEEYLVVERYAIGYEDKEPFVVNAKTGEKKSVKVQPYGREYVKVLEGVESGEVLLQQTKPTVSGMNRNRNSQGGNRQGGAGGGMPPMGGGMPRF
ncbi:MAG: efflux RND transporter periplasmic adaptor subunit [Treponema sp.]|nr:efflux RND transporter periplasmic adaptor subunit [Treponema sp.]